MTDDTARALWAAALTPPAPAEPDMLEAVLAFWFQEHDHSAWFAKDEAFDGRIRDRFGDQIDRAAAGLFDSWRGTGRGCLALCLLLDQFPRNLFRGSARAFAYDAAARAVAHHAVAHGLDMEDGLTPAQRVFLYLPFEHAEDLDDQKRCLRLMLQRVGDDQAIDYAHRHLAIIDRFGRFPHRNAALGRTSTEAERRFLQEPGSSF